MNDIFISRCVIVLGECCLLIDLGNRLFGSYARTLVGASIRILIVVLACVALGLPMLAQLLLPDKGIDPWLTISAVVSIAIIAHYLFPCRFGIRKIPSPTQSESRERLTGSIDVHSATMEGKLSKGQPAIVSLILSDLHCNTLSRLNSIRDALSALGEKDYDLVFVLGDLGEKTVLLPEVLKAIANVSSKHGTVLVRSNHDYEHGRKDMIAQLARTYSIAVLCNSERSIPALGISVVGLEFPWSRGPLPEPTRVPFAIGLTHTPDNITYFDRLGVPLVLAGHTHGGKFRLPLIGSILVPSRYGRFLDAGWFRLGNTVMHITPGIGYFPGVIGKRGTILQLTISNTM